MRLLIVEDEARMAALLKRGFAEEGYAADVVANGGDCVLHCAATEYDAVVLDVLLPDMDGFEVCRRLRHAGCWAPIVMLTARDAVGDRVRGLDAGADDYVVKPFSFAELCARVRALIRRGRHERPANAAHEVRTPLAILRTELELAGRPGRSREELADAVAGSSREVSRLVQLADNLLLLARTDEGIALDIQPDEPVRPLLEQGVRLVAPAAGAKGVRVVVEARPGLGADIDPGRLRQAVDNLLSNALRHAPPGSEVRLSARDDSGHLVIEVADQGSGFPAEFLPHAFERFRRADTGRARERGGSGLGLAVVQAIARAHGGDATAANGEGGGAVVRIAIPLRRC